VNGLTFRNDVNVFTGTQGEDSFGMYSTVNVGGSVIVNTGTGADYDYIDLGAVIKRNLSVLTGAGNDEISVGFSTIGGAAAINSAAGNDVIDFGSSTVGLNTVIDAGSGNDTVSSTALSTRYNLFVYLGAGNDALTLNNASAFAAFLYGGTGANTLTTNAPTRANVRTLRSFQFQTVNNIA
jgi:Ca2+-binding RTX toxin-like protein